jgi:hypothetical protein
MTEQLKELRNKLDTLLMQYVLIFADKHKMFFDYWIADLPGTIAVFGDYFFNFDDIRLDIDTNQDELVILEWYDATLTSKVKFNYFSWIKGYRPTEQTKKIMSDQKMAIAVETGLERMQHKPDYLLFMSWHTDESYVYRHKTICEIPVLHTDQNTHINDDRDCPFLPCWLKDGDYLSEVTDFRIAFDEVYF